MFRWVLLVALTQIACGSENCALACSSRDANPPIVVVSLGDTVFDVAGGVEFTLLGTDNISLLTIGWSMTGVVTMDSMVVFTESTPSYSEDISIVDGLVVGSAMIVPGLQISPGTRPSPIR